MEAVRHLDQRTDPVREAEGPDVARIDEHREAVRLVGPERAVVTEVVEGVLDERDLA